MTQIMTAVPTGEMNNELTEAVELYDHARRTGCNHEEARLEVSRTLGAVPTGFELHRSGGRSRSSLGAKRAISR